MPREIENVFSDFPDYNCFACGPRNEHGLRLRFFADDETGEVFTTFAPREHFSGWPGIVHGGVQCALVDEVSFWAMFDRTRKIALTAKIEITYSKKVPSDGTLDVRARVRSVEGRRVVVDSVINGGDGECLTKAAVTYFIPRKDTLVGVLGRERLGEKFLMYAEE